LQSSAAVAFHHVIHIAASSAAQTRRHQVERYCIELYRRRRQMQWTAAIRRSTSQRHWRCNSCCCYLQCWLLSDGVVSSIERPFQSNVIGIFQHLNSSRLQSSFTLANYYEQLICLEFTSW